MQDRETESLWSQVLGECISGEMEGNNLAILPAIYITYKEFKKQYPHGQLLRKPEKGSDGSLYNEYFTDKDKLGIFGRMNNFQKLDGKDIVYGLHFESQQVAVAEKYLTKNGYVIIQTFNQPAIIIYDKNGRTVKAFSLSHLNETDITKLKFGDDLLFLTDSQISWDSQTGKVESGKTKDLTLVPVTSSYWFAWISFFPHSDLIK